MPIIIHENELLLQLLWSMSKIERNQEILMSQQQGLDASVAGLGVDFNTLSANIATEIQALKDAQAAGTPLDFTGLNNMKAQFDQLAASTTPAAPPAPTA